MSNIPFKKILDFHEETVGKSDIEKKKIAQSRNIDFDEYKKRIIGKEKEIEFLIIMKATTSFKNIKPIDEELSQISGENTPDYEVEFIDNYKMMIEVKHTDKDKYSISGGNLQKRIDYAKAQNLSLRFAISIKGIWGLFTSDFIQSKKGKISISDFVDKTRNSWFDRELETCSYLFLEPLKIVSVYSNSAINGLNIFFEPYGELISYKLYSSNRLILEVNQNNKYYYSHVFILEAIQDRLANLSQKITKNGSLTTIVESSDEFPNQMFPEYTFTLAAIRHMRYSGKNSNDNMFLVGNDEDSTILYKNYIRFLMSDLYELGVQINCIKDGLMFEFDKYRNQFWKKNKETS